MKTRIFLSVLCLFCAAVSSAQNNTFIDKWETRVKSQRKKVWDAATKKSVSPQNKTVYVLHLRKQKVASFHSNSECQNEKKQLENIANSMFTTTKTSGSSDKVTNALLRAKAEADAKSNQKIMSSIKEQCSCHAENNPDYRPNNNNNTKSNSPDYGNLFTPDDETDNSNPLNSLFGDNQQTQYENIFDAPSARTPIYANTGEDVSLNLDHLGTSTGSADKGIHVGDPNWKSNWQTPVKWEESDYAINKFDAIKKEIAVDLKFRNEVADSIRAFLEAGTGSIPQLLHDLYKERTGYDIEDLRNRQNLTEEERKIAENYNHFVKQMAIELDYQANEAKKNPNPEKRLIDNAIMASDVYNSGSKSLEDTDWRPVLSSYGIENTAIAQAVEAINKFNEDGTGFYAQMYKNDLTGEYTLAFRGTDDIYDWISNVEQGFSMLSPQYASAAQIGVLLNGCKEKVNIVGHSLGGGLATVVGLQTGFPTYTYNQADISQGMVDQYKLDVSKSDNITAYYMDGEILTTKQNEIREYSTLIPLGKKVKTGSAVEIEESKVLTVVSEIAKAIPNPLVKAAGVLATKASLVAEGDAHRIPHMEQYFRAVYGESQVKWARYNNVQLALNNNNTYSNLLINTK
jgi:hypothetical protein